MKYLRKFDSVQGLNEAIQGAQISFMGLAYNNDTPVIGNKVVPPTPPTPITILVGPDNSSNGTVNGTNEVYLECTVGDVINVTAAGVEPYYFASWRDGYTNEYLPYANYSTNPLQLTVTQAMVDEVTNTYGGFYIIMAEFAAPNIQISAQVVPQDAGHITGTGSYTYGATAGLTVHEDNPSIYHFDGWSFSPNPSDPMVSGGWYFTFPATEDVVAYAHFSPLQS